MAKIYFTITGTRYYHGQEFLKKGMKVVLEKEPDNKYDAEAILVKLKGIGDIGHVANSPYTVLGESMSAGRLYDKIGDTAIGTVKHVLPGGVICKLSKKSRIDIVKFDDDVWVKTPPHIKKENLDDEALSFN